MLVLGEWGLQGLQPLKQTMCGEASIGFSLHTPIVILQTECMQIKQCNLPCKWKYLVLWMILSKFTCLGSLHTVHVWHAHYPPPLNCNQLTKTTDRLPEPLLHKKVHHSEPEEELVLSTRDFHGAPDFVMVHHTAHHRASHLSSGSEMLSRLCRLCRIFLRFGPHCG